MNSKKFISIITFSLILVTFLAGNIPITRAQTAEELLRRIAELQAEIVRLQKQLTEMQAKQPVELPKVPPTWCHDFNINLRHGNIGSEVAALQIALEKEGFKINEEEKTQNFFGDSTALVTVKFQEKYKKDILTPLGLEEGTGYVGKNTRMKLNELYGCKISIKPERDIQIIFPNGGEKLVKGSTYSIKWYCGPNINKSLDIWLTNKSAEGGTVLKVASDITCKKGESNEYSWTIPLSLVVGGRESGFKIMIETSDHYIFEESDSYFSIISPITPTITCSDSDEGSRSYIEGRVSLGEKVFADYCKDDTTVRDYICAYDEYGELTKMSYLDQACPYGCKDGACKPGITVKSPNGGEIYMIGEKEVISWFCGGVNKSLNIFLINKEGKIELIIASDVNCSPGWEFGDTNDYSKWTIPTSIKPEEKAFKVKIETADNSFFDESDDYFSILPSGAIPPGGVGLKYIENLLASVANVVSQLIEKFKLLEK